MGFRGCSSDRLEDWTNTNCSISTISQYSDSPILFESLQANLITKFDYHYPFYIIISDTQFSSSIQEQMFEVEFSTDIGYNLPDHTDNERAEFVTWNYLFFHNFPRIVIVI